MCLVLVSLVVYVKSSGEKRVADHYDHNDQIHDIYAMQHPDHFVIASESYPHKYVEEYARYEKKCMVR